LIIRAAQALLTIHEPERLVKALFGELAAHLRLELYFNFILAPGSDTLTLAGCHGIGAEAADTLRQLPLGRAVCGRVAQSRISAVVDGVQSRVDDATEVIRGLGIRAYACWPLIHGDTLIGTLSFGTRSRDCYEPDELQLMHAIADLVAVAIARYRVEREREVLLADAAAARDIAEAANHAKDEFIAVISHELRAPMTTALGWADLMANFACGDPLHKQAATEIGRSVRAQRRLVNDLFDVSRLNSGKLQIERAPAGIGEIVTRAVETIRAAANEKGVALVAAVDGTGPSAVVDADRIEQVVTNLVGNAVKFTPAGGRVEIALTTAAAAATLTVRDNGRGIRPELLPRIFDRFVQDTGKSATGLGLGLAIARHIVEAHGGTITAASDGDGTGATFTVTLPL
jgi:hypothetical protein